MDEQFSKSALDKFRQWHFWWLVIFSLLLIVTFVYYLPTRFLQQVGAPHDEEMPFDESQPHGHDPSGNSIPIGHEGGDMMMTDEEMHEDMNEHMNDEMDADDDHEAAYFEENSVKEGLVINLNISPVPYKVGVPLSMDFFVNEKPGNVPVLASKLQIEHEKLMHIVGVRSDMNEFFHIHPEFLADNPAVFSIDHTFNKPGLYKIWSEIKKDGVNYSFGHPEVNISGSGSEEDKKVSFSRNIITGDYQVSMTVSDMVVKERELDLSFDIHTLTGQEVDVEQYLGADMHLSIIKDDWSQFIHTHPEGHGHSNSGIIPVALANGEHTETVGGDEAISFTVALPEAGLYKAFAQFRPEGINLPADKALLAEFWIQVEEKAAFPVSQWWGLLIVSAVLMAGLSWLVKGYLKVKPEDVTVKK